MVYAHNVVVGSRMTSLQPPQGPAPQVPGQPPLARVGRSILNGSVITFNIYLSRVLPDALLPYMPIRIHIHIHIHTLPFHPNANFLADLMFPEPGGAVEEDWVDDLSLW